MKIQYLIALMLSAACCGIHAADVPANSKISAVTVYQDRAVITRNASVNLPPGEQQVVFEGLPINLDENSVRARGTGKGYKILGVELRQDYRKPTESEETKKLRDQITALEQKKQDLDDERNDLNGKRDLLNRLSNGIGGGDEKNRPSVTDIKTFTDYYGAQQSNISTRLRAIERTQSDYQKQIEDLQRQLAKIEQPGSPDKRTVVVTVDAESTVPADLQVDYMIYGCSWQPQYDVHYKSGEKNITLTAYGIIRQNTGENWDGVKTVLSTARPQQGTSVPDLCSWTVDFLQPIVMNSPISAVAGQAQDSFKELRKNSVGASGSLEPRFGGANAEEGKDGLDSAQILSANVEARGYSAVYKVPGSVTVPSDGEPHRCTISIQEMSAEQSYTSTPKLLPGAFVKAKVKNANAAPLLPGPINVFMENDFIGSSQLSLVGPDGVFDLFLGKDDSIKVQRKEKIRKEETSGLLSRSKVVKMGYTVELENMQNKEVTLTLKDQIPVSKNEQIRVFVTDMNIKPSEENKETGDLAWKITLPPHGKQKLNVDFQVESPQGMMVGGI